MTSELPDEREVPPLPHLTGGESDTGARQPYTGPMKRPILLGCGIINLVGGVVFYYHSYAMQSSHTVLTSAEWYLLWVLRIITVATLIGSACSFAEWFKQREENAG